MDQDESSYGALSMIHFVSKSILLILVIPNRLNKQRYRRTVHPRRQCWQRMIFAWFVHRERQIAVVDCHREDHRWVVACWRCVYFHPEDHQFRCQAPIVVHIDLHESWMEILSLVVRVHWIYVPANWEMATARAISWRFLWEGK